jgi:hypothetical protein
MTAETVDRMLRGWDPVVYRKVRRQAQARELTMSEYLSRLVKLHEAILASEQHESLDGFGLGRVSD